MKNCNRTHLEKNHTQAHSLDRVQDAEPKPKRSAEVGSSGTTPWNVQRQGRRSPQHLAPSGCTQADCKDWQKPSVRLAELGKDIEHQRPNTDEKSDNQEQDGPFGNHGTPKEGPVTTIRLYKQVRTIRAATGVKSEPTPLNQ